MFTPVEGIDYIFDRYAYLGLTEETSEKEIKAAIRQKRSENHPDRLTKAGKELKSQANDIMNTVLKCENVLLNPELREAFDIELARFKKENSVCVSTSGVAILDMKKERIDLNTLLAAEPVNMSEIEGMAATMSGFDAEQLQTVRDLYKASPDNDGVKKLFISGLTDAVAHFTLMEDFAWNEAGVFNKKSKAKGHVVSPDEYSLAVTDEIEHVQAEIIPQLVTEHSDVLKIGVQSTLLLTHAGIAPDKQVTFLDYNQQEAVTTKAREHFEQRSEKMLKIAEQKQIVLKELCLLSEHWILKGDAPTIGSCMYILMIQKGEANALSFMAFMAEDENKHLQGLEDTAYMAKTIAELKEMAFEQDTVAILFNPELGEPIMSIGAFFDQRRKDLGID